MTTQSVLHSKIVYADDIPANRIGTPTTPGTYEYALSRILGTPGGARLLYALNNQVPAGFALNEVVITSVMINNTFAEASPFIEEPPGFVRSLVRIDLSRVTEADKWVDTNGVVHAWENSYSSDAFVRLFAHELAHAILGTDDPLNSELNSAEASGADAEEAEKLNDQYPVRLHQGGSVAFENWVMASLVPGSPARVSYDDYLKAPEADFLQHMSLTQGLSIDRAYADQSNGGLGDGDGVLDTSAATQDLNDLLMGGPGIDTILSGAGRDFVYGGQDGDTIFGGAGDDHLYGDDSDPHAEITGNDLIHGQQGADTLVGGRGNDQLFGGDDNDVLISGPGNDLLDGGLGVETADYQDADAGIELTLTARTLEQRESNQLSVSDDGDGGHDDLFFIERIEGSTFADTLRLADGVVADDLQGIEYIDLAGNAVGDGDTIDVSQVVASKVVVNLQKPSNQYVYVPDDNANVSLKNVENVIGSAGVDWIYGNRGQQETNIQAGGGDDVVLGSGQLATIDLGAGADWLIKAGAGSQITGGTGVDTFFVTKDVLITDATPEDRVVLMSGQELTGGYRNTASESPYAKGRFTIGYAKNPAGELVIENALGQRIFVANYSADLGNLSAGIYIFDLNLWADKLIETANYGGSNLPGTYEALMGHALKALMGESYYNGTTIYKGQDPLVLDLDGDGIELTARSSVSPSFDLNDDGFAEQTGWIGKDDGLLARDLNANGTIDNVGELFGDATTSGFTALAALDSNTDGVINVSDSNFADLRVWRDADSDGKTDAGELKTLAEAGIVSINLTPTSTTPQEIAGNTVSAVGTFTKTGGGTGTVGDVVLHSNRRETKWLGDTSISTTAAALPEVKGFGTLSDLRVAMSRDPSLATVVQNTLPAINTVNLAALRNAAMPILSAWMESVDVPTGTPGLQPRPDVPILATTTPTGAQITDFGIEITDAQGTYWTLASGNDVLDENEDPIARPTLAQVLAQVPETGAWTVFTGDQIRFSERRWGIELPIGESGGHTGPAAIAGATEILNLLWDDLNEVALRLAAQGPLSQYFAGLTYDVTTDKFRVTSDRQLAPMLEAIMDAAPADTAGADVHLTQWKPLIDVLLPDLDRGQAHLITSYGFLFQNLVAAWENVQPNVTLTRAAQALDIPTDRLRQGTGTITGGDDPDFIYLNGGNQTFVGGKGPDTYVVGRDFGSDIIMDDEYYTAPQTDDTIRFAHLLQSDVTMTRDGLDLVITVNGATDTLRVVGQFAGRRPGLLGGFVDNEKGVHEIIFRDGTVLDKLAIGRAVSVANAAGTTEIGTNEVDYLDGGAGNDTLSGGTEGDVYTFATGYGLDTIHDQDGFVLIDSPDWLEMRDLTIEDVLFGRTGNSDNLTISINGASDALTISNQFAATYTGVLGVEWLDRIEGISFEDGYILRYDELFSMLIQQNETAGNDTIYGFDWEDSIDGGAGNDWMSGGNENDTYYFGLGYGQDTIKEGLDNILSGKTDKVVFGAGVTPASVIVQRVGSTNTVEFTLSDGSKLTVDGQFAATYTGPFGVQWFDRIETFEFADSTVWTAEDVMQRILTDKKTAGNDTIYGYARFDTMDGGAGNDRLEGGSEADTYVFGLGYGQDVVKDVAEGLETTSTDKVAFGAGITPNDIVLIRNGTSEDLTMQINGTSDSITIEKQFFYPNTIFFNEVEQVTFVDNTVWTPQYIREQLVSRAKTTGNDTVVGFAFADTLDGGAGNDTLQGLDGGDTYIFNQGYGTDTVIESVSLVTRDLTDRVQFGTGLTSTAAQYARTGNDLVITFTGFSGLSLTMKDQFLNNYTRVEEFQFADNVTKTYAQIWESLLGGTSGNDTLIGTSANDRLNGQAGTDSLQGRGGADTYVFDAGYGTDTIYDMPQVVTEDFGPDIVEFGAGITAANVVVTRSTSDTDDVTLTFTGLSDQLILDEMFNQTEYNGQGYNEIEEFHFADGTVWTYLDILAKTMVPTSGADTIRGDRRDNTVDGAAGNDILIGLKGNDTYVFNTGYGQDIVRDTSAVSGETDSVSLGSGVTTTNVTVSQGNAGADLIIEVSGTSDTLTLENTVASTLDRIQSVSFAGGTVWTYADLFDRATTATAGNDTFYGDERANTLNGGDGNDTLFGSAGADAFIGGNGSDTVNYSNDATAINVNLTTGVNTGGNAAGDTYSGIENITGAGLADTLTGDAGANVLTGGGGNDNLTGNDGDDTLDGGSGVDSLDGGIGNDILMGGGSGDTLTGGSGSDTASYATSPSAVTINLGTGSISGGDAQGDTYSSIENLTGSATVDSLTGDANANVLDGGGGNDTLIGGAGADTLIGGSGTDVASYSGASAAVVVSLASGGTAGDANGDTYNGVENVLGTSHDDQITGDAAANSLDGGSGNDMLIGGAGADSLTGGNGTDTASYANAAAGVLANLGSAGSNTGDAEGDTYTTIENLTGSDFADTLTGNSSANTIGGGMGSDTLSGGSGVDTLNGGDGDDTLIGGTSGDALDGGSGSDTASYSTSAVAVNVNLATGAVSGGDAVSDTFSSIENLTGTSGNDTLTGNTGANVLSGLAGTDTLSGGDGDDTLIGGSGGDTLTGGNGADTASYATAGAAVTVSLAGGTHTGDAASDTFSGIENLKGSAHNDTLTGDANANVVEGGLGNDTLAGGSGSDTYAFNRGDGADTVNNGDNTSSTDRLTFATDVAHDQLWFQQSGNDLVVTVIGTTDTVTLKNWYATTPDKLDEIRSSNGKFLTAANVQALVDAMSAYSPPAQGQTTLPAELQAALGSTIDANWQNILPPVIIDLNRDGFQFTPFEQSVRFDADNDGTKELVNWVGGGDGILALDRNADGAITSGNEISFIADKPGALSDLQGLTAFDSNNNGKLDRGDARFGEFKVWIDRNENGHTDQGELKSLADIGVTSIALSGTPATDEQKAKAPGLNATAVVTYRNGKTGLVADAELIFNELPTASAGVGSSSPPNGNAGSSNDDNEDTSGQNGSPNSGHGADDDDESEDTAAIETTSAIAIDVDKNGLKTNGWFGGFSRLDVNDDGNKEWVRGFARRDGVLALDRNGDGKITSGKEISFLTDKAGATTEFQGLSAFDTNNNGKLDANDLRFNDFMVWLDRNRNGRSDAGELKSLTDVGITSIGLVASDATAEQKAKAPGLGSTVAVAFTDGSASIAGDLDLPVVDHPGLSKGSNMPWLSDLFDRLADRLDLHAEAATNNRLSQLIDAMASFRADSGAVDVGSWDGRGVVSTPALVAAASTRRDGQLGHAA